MVSASSATCCSGELHAAVSAATVQTVVTHRLLVQLAKHPSLANVTLMYVDPSSRAILHGPTSAGDPKR